MSSWRSLGEIETALDPAQPRVDPIDTLREVYDIKTDFSYLPFKRGNTVLDLVHEAEHAV
jgi:hypothetical protein